MYEFGICTKVDLVQAKYYYKLALKTKQKENDPLKQKINDKLLRDGFSNNIVSQIFNQINVMSNNKFWSGCIAIACVRIISKLKSL